MPVPNGSTDLSALIQQWKAQQTEMRRRLVVRPLDPDEAREWLWHESHDHILARRLFPDD